MNADAESILQSHWASWVTEGDIQKIAGAGFNLVRIPVGYWAFEKYPGDVFIQGAADYLDKAVEWAASAGLHVWIDLHGKFEVPSDRKRRAEMLTSAQEHRCRRMATTTPVTEYCTLDGPVAILLASRKALLAK